MAETEMITGNVNVWQTHGIRIKAANWGFATGKTVADLALSPAKDHLNDSEAGRAAAMALALTQASGAAIMLAGGSFTTAAAHAQDMNMYEMLSADKNYNPNRPLGEGIAQRKRELNRQLQANGEAGLHGSGLELKTLAHRQLRRVEIAAAATYGRDPSKWPDAVKEKVAAYREMEQIGKNTSLRDHGRKQVQRRRTIRHRLGSATKRGFAMVGIENPIAEQTASLNQIRSSVNSARKATRSTIKITSFGARVAGKTTATIALGGARFALSREKANYEKAQKMQRKSDRMSDKATRSSRRGNHTKASKLSEKSAKAGEKAARLSNRSARWGNSRWGQFGRSVNTGVNRASSGMQKFRSGAQRFNDRIHPFRTARRNSLERRNQRRAKRKMTFRQNHRILGGIGKARDTASVAVKIVGALLKKLIGGAVAYLVVFILIIVLIVPMLSSAAFEMVGAVQDFVDSVVNAVATLFYGEETNGYDLLMEQLQECYLNDFNTMLDIASQYNDASLNYFDWKSDDQYTKYLDGETAPQEFTNCQELLSMTLVRFDLDLTELMDLTGREKTLEKQMEPILSYLEEMYYASHIIYVEENTVQVEDTYTDSTGEHTETRDVSTAKIQYFTFYFNKLFNFVSVWVGSDYDETPVLYNEERNGYIGNLLG